MTRGIACLLGLMTALALTGCIVPSDPKSEPATPTPIATVPAPIDTDRLAVAATRCATDEAEPRGDVSFVAEASWPDRPLPDGMTVPIGVRVGLASSHGKHAVDLAQVSGFVVDGDGTVVGLVIGLTSPTDGPSGGKAVSAQLAVTLGSCPVKDALLGDPLPDGEYRLVLSGYISPTDHDHAVGEYWLAPPLGFTVAEGTIRTG